MTEDEARVALLREFRDDWRTEYDDPEKVLALVRSGADEETVREALKAFSESVRLEAGLDMIDFEFMTKNTAEAFDMVTGGYASKPMTLATVIEQLVSERIDREVQESESRYLPLVEAAAEYYRLWDIPRSDVPETAASQFALMNEATMKIGRALKAIASTLAPLSSQERKNDG